MKINHYNENQLLQFNNSSPNGNTVKPDNMRKQIIELDKKALAKELATWRIRSGLTQRETAERFNVSRYSILRAENMKDIGIAMAYRISAALARAIREENGL